MTIDYHVHLEEGPYSPKWLSRTAKALESFSGEQAHTYESMQGIFDQLTNRIRRGAYSEDWLDLYLIRAKQLGLKEVGIVDHLYRFADARDYYEKHIHLEKDRLGNMQRKWLTQVSSVPSMDAFIERIESQKEKWEEEGVTLKLGIEADFFPGGEEKLERLLEGKPWDYVIGSVHFIKGWGFDNPEATYKFEEENLLDLYETHTSYVRQAIESELFDIIAHLDNLKVFSYRPDEKYLQTYYEAIAATLKKHDLASEINTGLSYRYPIKEACPSPYYLQTLARHDVPITLSSDAHYPDDLGRNLKDAATQMKAAGYKEAAAFSRRERYSVQLTENKVEMV